MNEPLQNRSEPPPPRPWKVPFTGHGSPEDMGGGGGPGRADQRENEFGKSGMDLISFPLLESHSESPGSLLSLHQDLAPRFSFIP